MENAPATLANVSSAFPKIPFRLYALVRQRREGVPPVGEEGAAANRDSFRVEVGLDTVFAAHDPLPLAT